MLNELVIGAGVTEASPSVASWLWCSVVRICKKHFASYQLVSAGWTTEQLSEIFSLINFWCGVVLLVMFAKRVDQPDVSLEVKSRTLLTIHPSEPPPSHESHATLCFGTGCRHSCFQLSEHMTNTVVFFSRHTLIHCSRSTEKHATVQFSSQY